MVRFTFTCSGFQSKVGRCKARLIIPFGLSTATPFVCDEGVALTQEEEIEEGI